MKISEYNEMMAYMLRPPQKQNIQTADLTDDLEPGPLKDELLKDFDPSQETYEEYLRRKSVRETAATGGRVGFYAGGVVRLAKLLSDQGKTINEILKEITIKFKELGGGQKGKPNSKEGVTNILKKELGEKIYKERYAPGTGLYSEQKRYGEDIIEKFKELRLTKTESDIEELLGLSPSYQTKLARDLGLEKKSGSTLRSEKFTSAKNIETEIDNLIDFNKGRNENLEEIFEKVKDKEFLIENLKGFLCKNINSST